ncbi:MAG: nucleotide sugar dehydrogenase [Pseudomonadota bacterium]|nr:nucleotide sugar dehydrogenase [Pseudomonadota bacterium]
MTTITVDKKANAAHVDPDDLHDRILAHSARIGVVGLGYVGLPLVNALAEKDFSVIGIDIDASKIEAIKQGRSYIGHIPATAFTTHVESGKLRVSTDFAKLAEADVVLICVPTPLTKYREPDLSYIENTARAMVPHLRPGQLIILESTTYPGTTDEVLRPILEESGLVCGKDLFIAFSPEREDPGNPKFNTALIPKVVGGEGPDALKLATSLYEQFVIAVAPVSSTQAAEAVKITENIFRSVNIALVNELKIVFEAMGIDIWEVIDAAATKPFGFMPFYPGPGLGGHCIPIDPFYLTWKAREHHLPIRFVELAGEINGFMPMHTVGRLAQALDTSSGKGLNGANILVLGVSYKKNIDDQRESPSLQIMEILEKRGAKIDYHDPYLPEIHPSREHSSLTGRRSVALTEDLLGDCDAVLICTDHDDVDYNFLVENSRLVVDTRNATKKVVKNRERIVKA